MIKYAFGILVFLTLALFPDRELRAQASLADSTVRMVMFEISYRGGVPAGDLGDRFGFCSYLGVEVFHKGLNNIYLGAGFQFFFADRVKELDMLNQVLTNGGFIVADNGTLSRVRARGEGFMVPVTIGKIFPLAISPNRNSGLYVELGGQFTQHKIGLKALDEEAAQLRKDWRKGYDRFTNGFGLRQGIGYKLFTNNGFLNLSLGLDFQQNFTMNRRPVNADTGVKDDRLRSDLVVGFRVSWVFPLYTRAASKVYYY